MPYVRCPHCATKLLPVASICSHCRRFLTLPAAHRIASACARCDSIIPWQATACPWCAEPRSFVRRMVALLQVTIARLMARVS